MRNEFSEHYNILEEISRGRFGSINCCSNIRSGEILACKTIQKADLRDPLDRDCIRTETSILRLLAGHRGIVEIRDVYEDEECVRLVMELCSGGDLFDRIVEKQRFGEKEAAGVMRGLMEAVAFCHRKGVAHRDLKPDNVLFADNIVKLADFGQASSFSPGEGMSGIVGTPYYVAPEVLEGKEYDQKVDVWSAGVILYLMLSGFPPFNGDAPHQIFEAVLSCRLHFPRDPWQGISHSAKDLIRRMLCRDAYRRYSADQVLGHPWMNESCV
uniref:Protein kinase domain-containing protein n=1 Tax=Araucaria cunninghamii TaxID=56994 RepID=A0A0D6R0J1_ARACU